jgi:hypothetical protein
LLGNIITVLVIVFGAGFLALQALRSRARKRRQEINVRTRDKMVAIASASIEFVPVEAAEVEGLNQEQLLKISGTLQQLGFERLLDYRLRRGDEPKLNGFERVLVCTTHKCFASIMVAGALDPQKPFSVAFNSYMEGGWRLGTSNIPARKADYFLRLPRVLRMRYPDDPIEKLYQRHMERREEVLRGLGIEVLRDMSVDAYLRYVREASEQRTDKVKTANPLGDLPLGEAQATARNQEWLGDYPAEAERRRRQTEARIELTSSSGS